LAKNKLKQFAELETFSNVHHHVQTKKEVENFALKGLWNSIYFKNNNPLVLELGCGKGEYTTALAAAFAHKNFIGVDLKGNRLWTGAKNALEQQLHNAAFLRTRIENIVTAFDKDEVDEIWITFPDPQPQEKRIKKRLTSLHFLQRYLQILKPGGIVHLKTDSSLLYEFTMGLLKEQGLEILLHTDNLYAQKHGFLGPHHDLLYNTRTHYEKKFSGLGFNINYIRFKIHKKILI
jgi:tRNA (guanine-N7-)-methyltransferase